jgi:hypothetical protein
MPAEGPYDPRPQSAWRGVRCGLWPRKPQGRPQRPPASQWPTGRSQRLRRQTWQASRACSVWSLLAVKARSGACPRYPLSRGRREPSPMVGLDGKGGYLVTLGRRVVDQLKAVRGPGESYSDVTLRLAKPSLESPERIHHQRCERTYKIEIRLHAERAAKIGHQRMCASLGSQHQNDRPARPSCVGRHSPARPRNCFRGQAWLSPEDYDGP